MSRPRVLIVDDDEHVCFVAARTLEGIAFCDSAGSVDEAVRALRRDSYDIVLLDVTLPGASGMTLLDRLRREWPQCAAVMLSALTDLSVAREALDRGAIAYIVKPFRVEDLRIQVTAALTGAQRAATAASVSARAEIVDALDELFAREPVACIVVDLEHVSLLKSSYGPDAIERLCATVVERLRSFDPAMRVLGQLGPAAFAAAWSLPSNRATARGVHALHRALGAPMVVDGRRIPIAARLGAAVASAGESAESILNLAEGAAGAARDGNLPFVVYDGDLRDTARMQLELLADAATAIHRGNLHVAYQSQHELESGKRVGMEALARWRHPLRGDIPASVFVPLAERMDLITELGASVLDTACADIAELRRRRAASHLRVSVNVSTAELRDVDYPARVERSLSRAGIPASALRLEVTESLALDGTDDVQRALTEIEALGIELSVDDFGTGYSSFSNLTRLCWAEIKLDRTLTAQCRDPRGREMLRSITAFGTALDIDVIAEGIETTEELDALRTLGCRFGQGFLLGRPQPIEGIVAQLDTAA